MESNQYVKNMQTIGAHYIVYLNVFVDIWSISPLAL